MTVLGTTSIIIENEKGEILLQLRDNKDTIKFPNSWGTFGGAIEENETPKECALRELNEELEYIPENMSYCKTYDYDGYKIHLFKVIDKNISLEDLRINEGQKGQFFSEKDLKNPDIKFAFNCKEIVVDYFNLFH